MPRGDRLVGEVTFWTAKGFGFIQIPGQTEEVFLHVSDCSGFHAREGDKVSFTLVPGAAGNKLRAANARLAK